MTPEVVPDESESAACITIELSERGGHVGFIDGGTPWRPHYFLPQRIAGFFDSVIGTETGAAKNAHGGRIPVTANTA